jgi:hypothetical protein
MLTAEIRTTKKLHHNSPTSYTVQVLKRCDLGNFKNITMQHVATGYLLIQENNINLQCWHLAGVVYQSDFSLRNIQSRFRVSGPY